MAMFGAKSLNCLVNPIETRYSPQAKLYASRTIAANWQALTFRHVPNVAVHVPAALPQHAAPCRKEEATEALAREWLARAETVQALRLRAYGRAKGKPKATRKLPTMSVAPSQLWPAEIRLAAGFSLVTQRQERRSKDALDMSLAELVATTNRA